MPHVNSGRLVALALASSKRNPKGQTIPTFSEFGIEGAEADIWYGFWGPKSLPNSLVKSLNNDLKSILLSSQVKDALEKQGLDVTTSSPEDLQNIVIKEIQNVSRIIDKNKISLN
jgi:tripartite-type tricarboxylate transporter receptor subunit TctC